MTPHFAAIISAPRNWEISWSPYRASQPFDVENGSGNPCSRPASMAAEMGIALMFCTPPATTTSAVPDITACAAKCTACCDEPHCRSTVTPGTSDGSPAASQHVRAMSPGLRADRVDASEDHVVHHCWVHCDTVEQRTQDVRAEVSRVDGGQPAAAPADRSADRIDDEGVSHGARLPS